MKRKTKVFVDAMALSAERSSGVGHYLHGIISALTASQAFLEHYNLVLVTTVRGQRFLRRYNFANVSYVCLPMLSRVMDRLPTTPIMPPMDVLLGKGIYFFPNYRRWPLLFSKSITTVHDLGYMLYPENLTPRHRSSLVKNVARWAHGSDKVLAVSENARKELIEHLKLAPKDVSVVLNGVDMRAFYHRSEAEILAVQTKYQLPANYILFVGNIEPRKNLTRLVQAYRRLPLELVARHNLVIVGGRSWLNEAIDAEIEAAVAEGRPVLRPGSYVGDVDLPALYSGAALLVHPALYEGFGMPLIEAMACETPVVSANNSSLREVAGDAAVLVDALNVDAIAGAIEQALTDAPLRVRLKRAGLAQAKKFSWEKSGRQLVEIIEELSPSKAKAHHVEAKP